MNEKELGKALLRLDADKVAAAPDSAKLTQEILSRDQRRVRLLTGLSIATWIAAGAVILLVLLGFNFSMIPHVKKLTLDIQAGNLSPDQTVGILHAHTVAFLKGSMLIAFSVFMMAVAALFTLLLIFATRRATLRQVTANLAQVSEQLRSLRATSSNAPPNRAGENPKLPPTGA